MAAITQTYVEHYPLNQDNQFHLARAHFVSYTRLKPISFYCAGMGSGKSNIIAHMPTFLKHDGTTILVAPNANLENQLAIVLEDLKDKLGLCIIRGYEGYAVRKTRAALRNGLRPFVLFHHLGPHNGKLNGSASKLVEYMDTVDEDCLVLIDEVDSVVTSLTGGINAKMDHSPQILRAYWNAVTADCNLFDPLRKKGAKVIGFSGTSNNLICSKLPSLGYLHSDIHIVNVHPIEALYNKLVVRAVDVQEFPNVLPYLREFEARRVLGKGLLIFGTKAQMTQFKRWYTCTFGHQMSHVTIDCTNAEERATDAWNRKLVAATYVCGINMVGVGFDLSTICGTGNEFDLGVLFRKMSDAISQPLSKNPEHDLYMEQSAAILQALARSRKGGVFVVPTAVGITSLYDGLCDVFRRIRDGYGEYAAIGGVPRSSQRMRHAQGLLLALIQNLRESTQRPVVAEVLEDLRDLTGRQFVAASAGRRCNFWTEALATLWRNYYLKISTDVNTAAAREKAIANFRKRWNVVPKAASAPASAPALPALPTIIPNPDPVQEIQDPAPPPPPPAQIIKTEPEELLLEPQPPTIMSSGGGQASVRTVDLDVKDYVIQRAAGVCCHCSRRFIDDPHTDDMQICHVQRNDCGGPFTAMNLMYGHKSCDASFDAGRLLHDVCGGYWVHMLVDNYVPDRKQVGALGAEFIAARFAWEKEKHGFASRSDDEFRAHLRSMGFNKIDRAR